MFRKSDLIYTFLHVPLDFIAVWLAFLSAYSLRGNGLEIYKLPISEYMNLVYVAVPLWILVFVFQGMYSRVRLFGTLQNLPHLTVASLAGWASFVVYLVFSKTEATLVFPRLMLIYILIFSVVYIFFGRLLLRVVQYIVRSLGYDRVRVAILGTGDVADEMEHLLKNSDDASWGHVGRIEVTTPEDVASQIRRKHIQEIIVADTTLTNGRAFEYLIAIQDTGALCHFVPNMFDVQVTNVGFSTLAGMPVLTFRHTPLEGWGRIVKRMFDVVMTVLAIILLSPLILLLMIVILITDPGPIFYAHERVGRNGRKFKMVKFRSMMVKYCTGPGYNPKSQIEIFKELGRDDLVEEWKRDQKVQDDPRITKIGKFMRKTRLDELPQLWNVLKGELSLVGPRAITDEELSRYGRWASYLVSIKPGVTGLWQVSGGNDISYDERVKLDAHYVQNWSLWEDMIIIAKTVLHVLGGGKGAY